MGTNGSELVITFRAGFGGTVIARGDSEYDEARAVWNGLFDYFGNYDALFSAPYDKIAIDPSINVLFIHSAGNDGSFGDPTLDANGRHRHTADEDGSTITDEIFCYSANGSGTDCPVPTCSAGISSKSTEDDGSPAPHCEPAP